MPGLAQRVFDLVALAASLADAPADIEPGHVGHRKRPHRKPEPGDCGVDLLRQRAFEQQPLGLDRAARQHPVADKAVADADRDRHLAEPPAERHRGGERVGRGRGTAHDLQQAHDIRRAEEMRPEHVLRPRRRPRDLVDIEGRGVGGEHRARLCQAVEIGKDPLFEVHLLEHRLDHDIGRGYRVELGDAVDQRHPALHLVGGEPAARHRRAIVGGNPVEAFLQAGRGRSRRW